MAGGGNVALGLGLRRLRHVELVVGRRNLLDARNVARGVHGRDQVRHGHLPGVEPDRRGL